MARRRRKKINYRNYILIAVGLIAIYFIYLNWSYFEKHFTAEKQISKTYDLFKKDLPSYSVFGIDVSQYQATINWVELCKEQKLDFVVMRATMGNNSVDTKFKFNWVSAKEAKLVRGAYHYYRPDENSKMQAEYFIANVKLEDGDLPPILDIEKYSRVQSIKSLKNGILNWLEIVEKYYDVTPILYTYNKFYISALAEDSRFDKYPIWLAWYNVKENPNTIINEWVFWQFTDKGILKGIEGTVDINVFNGKIQDLNGLRIKH